MTINQNIKLSLFFFICLTFCCCEMSKPKSYSFIYEDIRFGKKRYFKIEKKSDLNGDEIRFYHDHLDSNFVSHEVPRKILFQENKNILAYLLFQFPINRKNLDSCHIYEANNQEDTPPFTYKICLIRNIIDTTINNTPIKNASLYKLKTLYSTNSEEIIVIFDWDKKIIIEEKSKGFNIKLIKIESQAT